MAVIDALATEPHFLDHIWPVWQVLPPENRGRLVLHHGLKAHAKLRGIEEFDVLQSGWTHSRTPTLVSAFGDLRRLAGTRKAILMEHGAGQSYGNGHTSYVGGPGRENVALFLCPGERVARLNAEAWPQARSVAVGAPRTDRWVGTSPGNPDPIIAISFHWDCKVAPEARSAWSTFYPALRSLARAYPGRVLGHGHPRIFSVLRHPYKALGIEPVEDFEEIMARADLYAIDNSSTLFEFMTTGRPVTILNSPLYRRDVDLWPRFWWAADAGPNVDDPGDLVQGIARTFSEAPRTADRRREIASTVYANLGRASQAAARAITEWLEG
jgi:hypothetical protein